VIGVDFAAGRKELRAIEKEKDMEEES